MENTEGYKRLVAIIGQARVNELVDQENVTLEEGTFMINYDALTENEKFDYFKLTPGLKETFESDEIPKRTSCEEGESDVQVEGRNIETPNPSANYRRSRR